jgi:hypothetical protein
MDDYEQDEPLGRMIEIYADGTGHPRAMIYADALRRVVDRGGEITWALLLLEVVALAMAAEPGSDELEDHLVHVERIARHWIVQGTFSGLAVPTLAGQTA